MFAFIRSLFSKPAAAPQPAEVRPHVRVGYRSDHVRLTYYDATGRKVTARRVEFIELARLTRSLRSRGYAVC